MSEEGSDSTVEPGSDDADDRTFGEAGSRATEESIPIDLDRIGVDDNGPTGRDQVGTDSADDRISSRSTEPSDVDRPDEYGPEPASAIVEAGTPHPEHALFVLLGALAMVAVIARIAGVGF